jgi:hypothetical protein
MQLPIGFHSIGAVGYLFDLYGRCYMLDTGYLILDSRCWLFVTGHWLLLTGLLYITLRICNQASINNQMTEDREQIADEFGIWKSEVGKLKTELIDFALNLALTLCL